MWRGSKGSCLRSVIHSSLSRHRTFTLHHDPPKADIQTGDTRFQGERSEYEWFRPRRYLREWRKFQITLSGENHEIDSWMLRDSCPCNRCLDPSTTQKLFASAAIPRGIQMKDLHVNDDGSFSVSWTHDIDGYENHRSHFPPGYLASTDPMGVEASLRERYPRMLWNRADLDAKKNELTIEYDDYMADERSLDHVVRHLFQYGLAFISKVPPTPDAVAQISNRIGVLKNTIYGSTWDVRSVASAKNVADTSSDLDFHMDLLYYKEPPKLQILHFLKQSQKGGESLFSDSFKAVSTLVKTYLGLSTVSFRASFRHGLALDALAEFMIPFHYKNNGHWMQHEHPTILLDDSVRFMVRKPVSLNDPPSAGLSKWEKALQAVRWSPPFQAPMFRKQDRRHFPILDNWTRGARYLSDEFERPEAVYETRMEEGTCVIFDNWRILHARRAFSGGERWLRGAYIDDDTFRQRVLKLADSDI